MGVGTIEFRFVGLDDLELALNELGDALKSEVLADGLIAAAKPLVLRARQLAPRSDDPKQKKHLADSIKASRRVGGKATRQLRLLAGSAAVLVGPSAPHGHLVEFGHVMVVGGPRPTTRKDRRAEAKGRLQRERRVVGHVPAYPFMRPAWEATKAEVMESLKDQIGAALQRKIRLLSGKAAAGTLSAKDVARVFDR